MLIGIFFGLATALLNSIGYLFSSRFLVRYHSSMRLLVSAQFCMMCLALPFTLFMFPFKSLADPAGFWMTAANWLILFFLGQASFFSALRYFEASRLSSLLGLKIIVLAVFCIAILGEKLNYWQWGAVILAAVAGIIINWNGKIGKNQLFGWFFVCTTLICYSLGDINEGKMVLHIVNSGYSNVYSGFASTALAYTLLGCASLPFIFFFRLTKRQCITALPYASFWLLSQAFLFISFSLILPVFANVILATRGIFSVIIGAILPFFGLAKYDSKLTLKQWIVRGFAALLMLTAIVIYSLAKAGFLSGC